MGQDVATGVSPNGQSHTGCQAGALSGALCSADLFYPRKLPLAVCWTVTLSVLSAALSCSLQSRVDSPCLPALLDWVISQVLHICCQPLRNQCLVQPGLLPRSLKQIAQGQTSLSCSRQTDLCSVQNSSELLPIFSVKELSEASLVLLLVLGRHLDGTGLRTLWDLCRIPT